MVGVCGSGVAPEASGFECIDVSFMCIVATFTHDSAPLPEKNRATASAALLTPRHRAVNFSLIEEKNPEIACPQRTYQTLGSADGMPWLSSGLGGEGLNSRSPSLSPRNGIGLECVTDLLVGCTTVSSTKDGTIDFRIRVEHESSFKTGR